MSAVCGVVFNMDHVLLQTHVRHMYLGVVVEQLEDEAGAMPLVQVAFWYTDAGQAEYGTINYREENVGFIDTDPFAFLIPICMGLCFTKTVPLLLRGNCFGFVEACG